MGETRTELVFGEAVELDTVRVLVSFAADYDWNGVLFREHGDQGSACTSEYGTVRVD